MQAFISHKFPCFSFLVKILFLASNKSVQVHFEVYKLGLLQQWVM